MIVPDKPLIDAEPIDWTSVLKNFGKQHDMQFQETLRWISNRTSLQVACEVLGIALSPSLATRYTSSDLAILSHLGDFIHSHGYKVPRLMEYHRLEYKQKGRQQMGFSLSREDYLRERAAGKSKNKIAREQGISGPALFHWLHKWGLKDAAVEQREIELLQSRTGSEAILESIEPRETTIQAKPGVLDSPSSSNSDVSKASDIGSKNTVTREESSPKLGDNRSIFQVTAVDPRTRWNNVSVAVPKPDPAQKAAGPITSINLQLTMPVMPVEVPETLQIDTLSRDELMHAGLRLLQGAIGQAYHDLVGLLGESAAQNQIQHYIEHQVQRFIHDSSNS